MRNNTIRRTDIGDQVGTFDCRQARWLPVGVVVTNDHAHIAEFGLEHWITSVSWNKPSNVRWVQTVLAVLTHIAIGPDQRAGVVGQSCCLIDF